MSRWTEYGERNRQWHKGCGVYAIMVDGITVYIGSSSNVGKRICSSGGHFSSMNKRSFGRLTVVGFAFGLFECKDYIGIKVRPTDTIKEAKRLEKRLIMRLAPEGNIVYNPYRSHKRKMWVAR